MWDNPRVRGFILGIPLDEATPAIVGALRKVTTVSGHRADVDSPWVEDDAVVPGVEHLHLRTDIGMPLSILVDADGDLAFDWPFNDRADIHAIEAWFRHLAAAFVGDIRLFLDFDDARVGASPRPPLVKHRLIVAFPPHKIEQFFTSVEAFETGWDRCEVVAGTYVCSRALDADDVAEAIFDSNWKLARGSLPGQASFRRVLLPKTPGEQSRVDAEPEVLQWNGYRESDQAHAYTMASPRHISAKEVTALRRFKDLGEDGERPVKHVRVHFYDRDSAQREARPLLDGGIEVLYLADDGAYVHLTD
jgi:hypothetical protein